METSAEAFISDSFKLEIEPTFVFGSCEDTDSPSDV